MAASKHDDWSLIEVDFGVGFPFKEVNTGIAFLTAVLTKIVWTIFPTEAGTSVAAFENPRASLVTRKSIAGRCARH
jgi:hypothetical protein